MRISTIEGNGHFKEWASLLEVTLDGDKVDAFVYVDDEEGKVTYFDEAGELETTVGEVGIEFPEDKRDDFEDAYQDFLGYKLESE